MTGYQCCRIIYQIYRLNEGRIPIAECWRRSKKLLLCFSTLILAENVIMLIPLLVLKIAIGLRNSHLAEDFPPTADERYSTEAVDDLLEKGASCALALPLISGRLFDRLSGFDTTILGIDIQMVKLCPQMV